MKRELGSGPFHSDFLHVSRFTFPFNKTAQNSLDLGGVGWPWGRNQLAVNTHCGPFEEAQGNITGFCKALLSPLRQP